MRTLLNLFLFLFIPTSGFADAVCNSIPEDFPSSVRYAAQTTVYVRVTFRSKEGAEISSGGSGFLINSSGRIATAFHIFENYHRIKKIGRGEVSYRVVLSDCRSYAATAQHEDEFFPDIIFLDMVNPPPDLPTVSFEKTLPAKGESVYAIGSPYGRTNVITEGRVLASQVERKEFNTSLIYASTYIEPGNSGGVLVNTKGKILGMTEGCDGTSVGEAGFICTRNGYFIPIALIDKWMNFLDKRE